MNKATFVSELPNNPTGNEVPTLNLVKSVLSSSSPTQSSPSQSIDINGQPVFYAILSEKTNGAIFQGLLQLNTTPLFLSIKLFDQQLVGIMSRIDNSLETSYESIKFVFITLDGKEYLALKFVPKGDLITTCKMFPMNGDAKWINEENSSETNLQKPILLHLTGSDYFSLLS